MKRNLCLVLGLMVATSALACQIISGIIGPIVRVSVTTNPADKWREIGAELGRIYGEQFRDSEIYRVSIPVQPCLAGICRGVTEIVFPKPCGKSLQETANRYAFELENAPSGGGSFIPLSNANPFEGCYTDVVTTCMTVNGVTGCRVDSYLDCGRFG